jgi:hypothetical protein
VGTDRLVSAVDGGQVHLFGGRMVGAAPLFASDGPCDRSLREAKRSALVERWSWSAVSWLAGVGSA